MTNTEMEKAESVIIQYLYSCAKVIAKCCIEYVKFALRMSIYPI